MSRNCNSCNVNGKKLKICSSKFPSYLNQVLLALQMLQLNPCHRKGADLKDIERFMKKQFNANGDVQNQITTALLQAIKDGYVYLTRKNKFFNLGAIAGVQLSNVNSQRRCAEIENVTQIFVSSPIATKCEQKRLRISKCNTKSILPCGPKMNHQRDAVPYDDYNTTKLIDKFTDFIKNTNLKLPCTPKTKTVKCDETLKKCAKKTRKRRGVLSRTLSKLGKSLTGYKRRRKRSSSCINRNNKKRKCNEYDYHKLIKSKPDKTERIKKEKVTEHKDKEICVKKSTSTCDSDKLLDDFLLVDEAIANIKHKKPIKSKSPIKPYNMDKKHSEKSEETSKTRKIIKPYSYHDPVDTKACIKKKSKSRSTKSSKSKISYGSETTDGATSKYSSSTDSPTSYSYYSQNYSEVL